MRKINPIRYYLLLFSIVFLSCQKENDPVLSVLPEKALFDQAYGINDSQKMDIYLPAARSSSATKVVILIHGGGWNAGDKTDFASYIDTLKKRLPDYAIFNINYRLATVATNFFPTQENDVKAAVEYIFSKTNEFNISQKFVLLGISAGAHLCLLQAYKYTNVKIKAVVDFFGPTDMTDMYNNPASSLAPPEIIAAVVGTTPTANPVIYKQSSPVNYVTAQSPPTIILQGGVDVLVSPSQSIALKNKLQSFGVVNQYVFYPTENHGWFGPNLSDSFDKIAAFLNINVK